MASLVETAFTPFPHGKVYNKDVITWNNATLIVRGIGTGNQIEVLHHLRGKWTKRITSGDLPKSKWLVKDVQVINDKMYVLVPYRGTWCMTMYCLNLHTWIWKKLSPSGKAPLFRLSTSSWAYKGDIYFFGGVDPYQGFTSYNEVFSYNIATNLWKWPAVGGDLPSQRCWPWIIIRDETVFLFGGSRHYNRIENTIYNDLHTLDMSNMIWRKVHGNLTTGSGPKGDLYPARYTFTCISQSIAVVFGASCSGKFWQDDSRWEDDCWRLSLQSAERINESSSIWTKIPYSRLRTFHAAVLQPLSKRLWIIGGCDITSSKMDPRVPSSSIMKLNFNQLRSLKDLAMDYVARNICAHDPKLASEDQMTRQLRNEIEAYKCEIGDQYSCPDEDWRNGCLLEEKRKSSILSVPRNTQN